MHIFLPVTAAYAKYKLTIDQTGTMQWLWAGQALQLTIPNGAIELGNLAKQWRMPSLVSRQALGGQITHTALRQSAVNDLLTGLAWACTNDDQRLGIVPNDSETESSIVVYSTASLDLTDELQFQPRDNSYRLTSVTLQLDPAP